MDTCNTYPLHREGRVSSIPNYGNGSMKPMQCLSDRDRRQARSDDSRMSQRISLLMDKACSDQQPATNCRLSRLPSLSQSAQSPNKLHSADSFEKFKLLQQALCGHGEGQKPANGNQKLKQTSQQGRPLSEGKCQKRSLNEIGQCGTDLQKRDQKPTGNERPMRRMSDSRPSPICSGEGMNKSLSQQGQENSKQATTEQIQSNENRVFITQGTPTIIEVRSPKHYEPKTPANCETDFTDSDDCYHDEPTDCDIKAALEDDNDLQSICDCYLPEDIAAKNFSFENSQKENVAPPDNNCRARSTSRDKNSWDMINNSCNMLSQNNVSSRPQTQQPYPFCNNTKKDVKQNLSKTNEEKLCPGNEPAVSCQPAINQPQLPKPASVSTPCSTPKGSILSANRPLFENQQAPQTKSKNQTIEVSNTDTIVITPGETTVIEVRSHKNQELTMNPLQQGSNSFVCDACSSSQEKKYKNEQDLQNIYKRTPTDCSLSQNCSRNGTEYGNNNTRKLPVEQVCNTKSENRRPHQPNDKQKRQLSRKRPSEKGCCQRTCTSRNDQSRPPIENNNEDAFFRPDYDTHQPYSPHYTPQSAQPQQRLRQYQPPQQFQPLPEQYPTMYPQMPMEPVYSQATMGTSPGRYQQPYQPPPLSTLYSSKQCQDLPYYPPQQYQAPQTTNYQWNPPQDVYQNGQRYPQYPMSAQPTNPVQQSSQYRRCSFNDNQRYHQDQGRGDNYHCPSPSERNSYKNQSIESVDNIAENNNGYDYEEMNNCCLHFKPDADC